MEEWMLLVRHALRGRFCCAFRLAWRPAYCMGKLYLRMIKQAGAQKKKLGSKDRREMGRVPPANVS
jgi:hypothetical protein